MQVNSSSPNSRAPRIYCILDGIRVDGVLHAEWTKGGSKAHSNFELTISVIGSQIYSQLLAIPRRPISGQIYVSIDRNAQPYLAFDGIVDQISADPLKKIMSIHGRDYSCLLIETAFQHSFLNQTASEIVGFIASRHGFGTESTPTTELVGEYRENDHMQMVLNAHSAVASEWALLSSLAQRESFELFFNDDVLVFAPLRDIDSATYSVDYADLIGLKIHNTLSVSGSAGAVVKSWNSWLGRQINSDGASNLAGSGLESTAANQLVGTEIVMMRPNLTEISAQALAQKLQEELTVSRTMAEISMPGDLLVRPHDTITVTDNETGLSTPYSVISVQRSYSAARGFLQRIKAADFTAANLLENP